MQDCKAFLAAMTTPGAGNNYVIAACGQPMISATPQVVFDLNFCGGTTPNSSNNYLPPGEVAVIVQRNPAWAYIYSDNNITNQAYSYQVYFAAQGAYAGFSTTFYNTGYQTGGDNPIYTNPLPMAFMISTLTYSPHTAVFYNCTTPDGRSWTWLDGYINNTSTQGVQVNFSFSGIVAGNDNFSIVAYFLDPATGLMDTDTNSGPYASNATGTHIFYPLYSTYYSFEIVWNTATSGSGAGFNLGVTVSGTGAVMCHNPIPGYGTSSNSASDLRIMGASVLASCISPALYRNGDIVVTQQAGSKPWITLLKIGNGNYAANQAVYANITNATAPTYYRAMTWEKGGFAYLKPENGLTTLSQMPYRFRTTAVSGINNEASVHLDSPFMTGDYLMVYIKTLPTVATINTPAGIGRFIINFYINFTPNSPWLSGTLSPLTTAQTIACIDELARAPQFFENPDHLAATARFVAEAARVVAPHAIRAVRDYMRGPPPARRPMAEIPIDDVADVARAPQVSRSNMQLVPFGASYGSTPRRSRRNTPRRKSSLKHARPQRRRSSSAKRSGVRITAPPAILHRLIGRRRRQK
jgi:hypothetical protein